MRSWHQLKTCFVAACASSALLLGAPALGWADPAGQANNSGQSETAAETPVSEEATADPLEADAPEAQEAAENLDAQEAAAETAEADALSTGGAQGEKAIDPAAAEVVAAQNAQLANRDAAATVPSAPSQTATIPAANKVPLVTIQFSDPNVNYETLTKEQGYQGATVIIKGVTGMDAVTGQSEFTATDAKVKIRGNSTSNTAFKKRPMNIKLTSKQGLLGMPEGKTWVLLADTFDPTLLRNYLALDLASAMGIPGAAEHRMVQVVVNGQYKGVFELTQQAKKLVKVDAAQGGFIIESAPDDANEAGVTYLTSSPSNIHFEVADPDPITEDQKTAIQTKINEVDSAICSGDWSKVQAVVDTASFAKMYVLQEYVKNFDQVNSFFFYWQDGKLHSGMPWDFDLSQGNVNPGVGGQYYTGSGSSADASSGLWHLGVGPDDGHWFDDLAKYQGFCDQVMEAWKNAQTPIEQKDSAQAVETAISTYGEVLKSNYQDDGGPWKFDEYIDYRRGNEKTFDAAINYLKDFLTKRKEWLTQNLSTELQKKVQYHDTGTTGPSTPTNPTQPTKLPTPTDVCWEAPDRTANTTDGNATSQASAYWETGTSDKYGVQVLKDGTTVVGQGITDENGFDFPVKQAGTYTFKVCTYPSDPTTELQSDVVDSATQQNGTLVTVSMNLGGGKLPDGAPSVAVAIKGQGAGGLPTPTRDDYTFEGWKKADGSSYDPTAALSVPETVTAQWKAIPPTKLPTPTDVKWEVPAVATANGATVMNAEATWTDPTSDPCQFGIQVYRDGKAYGASGLVDQNGAEVPLTQAGEYTFEVCTYPDKGDIGKAQSDSVKSADQPSGTLETVTFEANGGTLGAGCPQIAGVIKGTPVGKPADPTRDGYDFKGWQKDGADYSFGSNVDTPIVLTAQWEAKQPVQTATKIDVPAAVGGLVYNGSQQTGVQTGTGYTVTGNTATNAGTYTATVTLASGYEWKDGSRDSKTVQWSIAKADFGKVGLPSGLSATYTGSAITPAVRATFSGHTLKAGADYAVSGSGTAAGSHKVTVSPRGNFAGSARAVAFKINPLPLNSKGKAQATGSYSWNGSAQTPTVRVTAQGHPKTLAAGTDYTVVGSASAVGSHTVTVRGKGNFSGDLKVTFTIAKGRAGWLSAGGQRRWSTGSSWGSGWLTTGGQTYWLRGEGNPWGPAGSAATGWLDEGGQRYFLRRSDNQWGPKGSMGVGWLQEDGSWYFFRRDGSPYGPRGSMGRGWLADGGKWYFFDRSSGRMATGWVADGGSWYYLDGSGAMLTGWYRVGRDWYWSDASGRMASDRWVGDYYLTGSGAMATSRWVGRYWVDASGRWTRTR